MFLLWAGLFFLVLGTACVAVDRRAVHVVYDGVPLRLHKFLIATTHLAKAAHWLALAVVVYAVTWAMLRTGSAGAALTLAFQCALAFILALGAGSAVIHTIKLLLSRRRPRDELELKLYGFIPVVIALIQSSRAVIPGRETRTGVSGTRGRGPRYGHAPCRKRCAVLARLSISSCRKYLGPLPLVLSLRSSARPGMTVLGNLEDNTYSVVPVSRSLASAAAAARITSISAWAVGSFLSRMRFPSRASTSPAADSKTAPTGTSPRAPASWASAKAREIQTSSASLISAAPETAAGKERRQIRL
jgi:hypothetical protein